MPHGKAEARTVVPAVAAALAVGWLAGAIWLPDALGPLTAVAVAAAFGLDVAARPAGRAWPVVATVAAWLALGFGGALWLRSQPLAGLAWTLAVLFVVPLPLVPWLYARGFDETGSGVMSQATGDRGQGTARPEGRS